eukprot:5892471-Karenia_brevis.AAC.1
MRMNGNWGPGNSVPVMQHGCILGGPPSPLGKAFGYDCLVCSNTDGCSMSNIKGPTSTNNSTA